MEVSPNLPNPRAVAGNTILVHDTPTMDRAKLGMLTFIASEAIFFLLLILAYVYYGSKTIDENKVLDVGKTAIFTVFLFASSGTIFLAERGLKKRNRTQLVLWLVVTIIFGAIFLVGQGMEYATLLGNEKLTPGSNLFGTTFFTLTGFHGLHVFIGLIMLTILAGMAAAGNFKGPHSSAIETISYYWHFVDVVWVFVFSVVYIIPALTR